MDRILHTHSEEISVCMAQAENITKTAALSVFISIFCLILDPMLLITHISRAAFY